MPGIPEAMRAAGLTHTPHAMLSRGVAAIRGGTLIINLPGSPRGARENLEAVAKALPHALEKLRAARRSAAPRKSKEEQRKQINFLGQGVKPLALKFSWGEGQGLLPLPSPQTPLPTRLRSLGRRGHWPRLPRLLTLETYGTSGVSSTPPGSSGVGMTQEVRIRSRMAAMAW